MAAPATACTLFSLVACALFGLQVQKDAETSLKEAHQLVASRQSKEKTNLSEALKREKVLQEQLSALTEQLQTAKSLHNKEREAAAETRSRMAASEAQAVADANGRAAALDSEIRGMRSTLAHYKEAAAVDLALAQEGVEEARRQQRAAEEQVAGAYVMLEAERERMGEWCVAPGPWPSGLCGHNSPLASCPAATIAIWPSTCASPI